jgi:hypothetical protein
MGNVVAFSRRTPGNNPALAFHTVGVGTAITDIVAADGLRVTESPDAQHALVVDASSSEDVQHVWLVDIVTGDTSELPVWTVFHRYRQAAPPVMWAPDSTRFVTAGVMPDTQNRDAIYEYLASGELVDRRATSHEIWDLGAWPTCGQACTAGAPSLPCDISGTPSDDRLVGTSKDDVICGLGGDDVIRSSPGRDVVVGGDGTDLIKSSRSNPFESVDLVGWQAGFRGERVVLSGIEGAVGRDNGNELAGDAFYGDKVRNFFWGLGGRDSLVGRGGNDRLIGGSRRDAMDGGPGDDWLNGNLGADSLSGGTGADSLVIDQDDFYSGGPGDDRCRLTGEWHTC